MSGRPGEFELIARYFAPLAGEGAFGLLDDAAVIPSLPGHDLVVTKDMLVAGVHFFADDPADLIARKALRVNLSDLAAKGAAPAGFLLGLALPEDWRPEWVAAFAAGLGEDVSAFGCPLLGGDTVRMPGPLTVSITAFGFVPAGRMIRRTTSRRGDILFATGTIGDSAIGLQGRLHPLVAWKSALPAEACEYLAERYLLPQPRLAMARILLDHANAAMDISDGFVGDLTKMLQVADLGAEIELDAIPFSGAVRAAVALDQKLRDVALTGGDDYELLISVPQGQVEGFLAATTKARQQVTRIGHVTPQGPVTFLEADGDRHEFACGSFVHF